MQQSHQESSYKTMIAENSDNCASNLTSNVPNFVATDNVASITPTGSPGAIVITYTTAKGLSLTLTPYYGAEKSGTAIAAGTIPTNQITWVCTVDTADNTKYVRSNCRTVTAVGTDVAN